MKFDILDRLMLLNILPKEGDFITLKIIRDLQGSLSFSEKEIKDFEIKNNEVIDGEGKVKSSVGWNPTKNTEKEIEIGEKATEVIVDSLKNLDKAKKLTEQHIPLYEKFIKP